MWETSVTTSLTSIRPVSHGSGLDRDAHQDEGEGRGGRWSGVGGRGQHHRDGAARMDQTPREVLVRWDGGRRERVTSSALHCNHLFFSFLFFFLLSAEGRQAGLSLPAPTAHCGQPKQTVIIAVQEHNGKRAVFLKDLRLREANMVKNALGATFC